MAEIITWLSGKDELHKLKSLKLTKVIIIKVSYITQERNEWTTWHGDTDVVRRYKQNVYLSDDEVKSAVEKLRTPGTYFSIDEAPAFLFISDDIGYLVTEFYTDNPLHDLHSEEKSWVSCKNILDVDSLIPESRFRFKYLIRGLGQPPRACTNDEVFYHMTSSSGGKKNGLAWALKPRPIDIKKYLQHARIINEAIQGSNVGSIVGDGVDSSGETGAYIGSSIGAYIGPSIGAGRVVTAHAPQPPPPPTPPPLVAAGDDNRASARRRRLRCTAGARARDRMRHQPRPAATPAALCVQPRPPSACRETNSLLVSLPMSVSLFPSFPPFLPPSFSVAARSLFSHVNPGSGTVTAAGGR